VTPKERPRPVVRIVMSAVSISIVVLLAILLIDLLTRTIRVLSGFPAVAALFAIVGVGILCLIAPMVISAVYAKAKAKLVLTRRFLIVTAVQGFVLFLSEVLRRLVLNSVGARFAQAVLTPWNHAAAVGGLVVGLGALLLAHLIRRRLRFPPSSNSAP
jgi:hypothetical protein